MMTADLYGTCIRDRPERNDCYWGKDATGRDDGCLKIGWKGRQCPHWRPAAMTERVFHMKQPFHGTDGTETGAPHADTHD